MKKLIPALALLLVSAVLLGTSTFAWFTMNNRVTVTGMSVTTKVSSNLLIAATNSETNYATTLNQTRTAVLEPVSSKNGTNFFYTAASNVYADGSPKAANYVAYNESDSLDGEWSTPLASATAAGRDDEYSAAFNTAYANTVTNSTASVYYGYVDFTFFLKATNAEASAKELRLTTCNLLYNSAAIDFAGGAGKAWRIAVFSQASAAETATSGIGTLKSILAPSGATYFTSGKAAATAYTAEPYAAGTVDTVSNLSTAVVIDTVTAGATNYYKVVVRLWLEGEDDTCNNETYANLTSAYTLDLAFEINEANSAVTTIGSVAP